MITLNELSANFAKLSLRERQLAVVAAAAILYFVVDLALLVPQQNKIKGLKLLDKTHKSELASINKALAEIEKNASKSSDQMLKDRATIEELKKQIADVDLFFGQVDATTSQVGTLLKELLGASPGLALLSLKTLPVTQFYSPESKAGGGDKAANAVQKTIYRHGVEIGIKGNYMALLPYMEKLQNYPKRLFWYEARLDVPTYPDAVLKLVIYFLSDQPSSPLF